MNDSVIDAVKRASPPLVVALLDFFDVSLSVWLLRATLLYTVLQIVLLVRRELLSKRSVDPACAEDCPAVRRRK